MRWVIGAIVAIVLIVIAASYLAPRLFPQAVRRARESVQGSTPVPTIVLPDTSRATPTAPTSTPTPTAAPVGGYNQMPATGIWDPSY